MSHLERGVTACGRELTTSLVSYERRKPLEIRERESDAHYRCHSTAHWPDESAVGRDLDRSGLHSLVL